MYSYPESLELLVEQLRKLPSIGRKSAQRLALHIVEMNDEKIVFNSKIFDKIEDAESEIRQYLLERGL